MDLMVLTQKLTKQTLTLIPIMGLALVVIAFGFKMALAPFHIWTPDVYQGSPAPTTAFIASVSKVGAFAFIVRYLSAIQLNASSNLMFILIVLAVLSMFVGNLLAMRQSSVKRLLAGSSIAHMGYLLTAVLAGGIIGKSAATFYITIYVISSVGIFGILSIIGYSNYEIDKIDDLKGLFYNRPWIAVVLTTLFLSLAGVPLTAGFLAKFYVVMAGASVTQWMLVVVLIVNSIIALYYYLKVIASMFISHETNVAFPSAQFATTVAVSFIFIVIIWLGIMPSAIMEIITKVLAGI
jgi:NADH-quinone oxidoreductase subunit N